MTKKNLANLSEEVKAEIELHKRVCFARHKCRGMSKIQMELYIKTLDNDLRTEIKRLTLLMAKA